MIYECPDCHKTFDRKFNFELHKKRKRKCTLDFLKYDNVDNNQKISDDDDINLNQNKLENTIEKPIKITSESINKYLSENKCIYCGSTFMKKSNVIKHMKNNCKKMKEIESKRQDIFNRLKKLEDDKKKIEEESNKLKEELRNKNNLSSNSISANNIHNGDNINNTINNINNIDNSINNTINNTNNINNSNSIMLVNYGDEDMSKFKREKIANAMNKVYRSPLALTELVHFNPKHPEYHNIFIPKMNEKYAMVYEDDDWKILHKDNLANRIYYDKKFFVENNFESYKDLLPESKMEKLQKFIDDDRNGYQDGSAEIKEDIKILLYNNRKMAIEQKKILDKIEKDKLKKIKIKNKYIAKIKNKEESGSDSD
jgi:hypothetical protein